MFPIAVSIKSASYCLLKITDSQPFDLARQELEASWSEHDVSRVTIMHDGGHDHPSTLSPLSHASPSVYSLGETAGGRKTTHLGASIQRLTIGWLLGAGMGMVVGFAIGLSTPARSTALPLVSAPFPIPKIAGAPNVDC